MATGDITTIAVPLTTVGGYVLLADGTTVAIAGISVDYSGDSIRVASAAAQPLVTVDDFIVVSFKSPFRETISAATKLWGLPYLTNGAKARVMRSAR